MGLSEKMLTEGSIDVIFDEIEHEKYCIKINDVMYVEKRKLLELNMLYQKLLKLKNQNK